MLSSNLCSAGAVGGAASQVSLTTQQDIFQVLLAYLNNATDVINTPGSANIVNNSSVCFLGGYAQWLKFGEKDILKWHWQNSCAAPDPYVQIIKRSLSNDLYLCVLKRCLGASGCRVAIANDAEWLDTNLGPFSIYASYAQLRVFNLSVVSPN